MWTICSLFFCPRETEQFSKSLCDFFCYRYCLVFHLKCFSDKFSLMNELHSKAKKVENSFIESE